MVAYINAYKNLFGVEPICRVLRDHNVPIAPSTYYAAKKRQASARQQSDERLLEVIHRVHRENFGVYGVRKVWHALQHESIDVGRDQVARLMRIAGLKGMTRRRKVRTTIPTPSGVSSPDLVRRDWFQDAPDIGFGWRTSRTCSLVKGGGTCRSCRMASRGASWVSRSVPVRAASW